MKKITKTQPTITKLFKKQRVQDDDCLELEEEIKLLEQKLKDKQMELFQVKRNLYRRPISAPPAPRNEQCPKPNKLMLLNIIQHEKDKLEALVMLTGLEVKSYVKDDHCVIAFHMQNRGVTHGLRIDMKADKKVSEAALPLGFDFNAVVEQFECIMSPECLNSVHDALAAYYDRNEQFHELERFVLIEAQLSKLLDGTHVSVSFRVQREERDGWRGEGEEGQHQLVVMTLDYMVHDIRPRQYNFNEEDLPEGMADMLRQQCVPFKYERLKEAFKHSFLDGIGPYKIVRQVIPVEERPRPRPHPRHHNPNHDDTFHPEDASESSGDEDERHLRRRYGRRAL